jgi:para-nitrobenzyl esterase
MTRSLLRNHVLALAASCAASLAIPAVAQPSPTVTIDSGRVEGSRLGSGIDAYLGIPYAAPPVRALRWRDPQPVTRFERTFHADRFAPQCPQPGRSAMANQYSGAEVTSEDCLYLNVWAKPGLRKAPVVVYLHGGAFFIGSASMPIYGGEGVARRDAVFVNLNYRLGVLGFLSHPALTSESSHASSGNYGFLDQIAALQWVHRNIAAFGGDPANVTLVGQSAGSMSVLALQASPLAKGLFQRAVGMSGASIAATGPFALRPLAQGEAEGVKFQQLVKAASLDDLRTLPVDRLTVPRTPGAPMIGALQDGYVLPQPVETIFAAGRQNDVPLLLGFARDEALGGFGSVRTLAEYRARATERFGDRAARFLTLYPAATDAEAQAMARIADRDASIVAPMRQWAEAQGMRGKAPVYSYMFAHPHSYVPGVTFSDLDPATAGAYHTSEVPFWLGTLDSFNLFRKTRAWTTADRTLSDRMTDTLVAFARTGKPDTTTVQWPVFAGRQPELVELNTNIRSTPWPTAPRTAFFVGERIAPGGPKPVRD